MHFKYIFGLILMLCLITKSHSRATEATIFYEDDDAPNSVEDDYYNDDEELDTDTTVSITNHNLTEVDTTTATTTTLLLPTILNNVPTTSSLIGMTTTNSKISNNSLNLPKFEPNCPNLCDCKNDFQFINCSHKNLQYVPNDIPKTVLILDLSYNLIENLQNDSFENYQNLRELILTGNQITNISEEAFSKLQNLTKIILDGNLLKTINPDTFENLKQLKMLNLNNNAIEITTDDAFLNQNYLKELYLSNNSITQIYDETFNRLIKLKTLSMDYNDFNQKINIKAFKPLKELTQLKLPNLENDTIKELCEILTSIDIVNFEKFDISCFELSSGQTFNESIIIANQNLMNQQNVIDESKNNTSRRSETKKEIMPTTITSSDMKTTGSLVVLGTTTQAAAGSSLTSTLVNNESTLKLNESLTNLEGLHIKDNDEGNENTYQVAISSQAINHILIAIIIVAVIGLLIGVICRKDICGIKTKLCRTKRPPSTDQARPGEEVPLNKIV